MNWLRRFLHWKQCPSVESTSGVRCQLPVNHDHHDDLRKRRQLHFAQWKVEHGTHSATWGDWSDN